MNNCCKKCYQGAYHCANTYCACHGLRPAAPPQENKNWMKEGSAPQDFTISGSANLPTTSLQEERNTEPWLSIEGVLWDVRGGVTLVEEGMKLIRGYLETTTPPQPDQFSQVAKKVPEPWVREFQTVCEEISVRYDEPVYGHAIIESFIQKTLEADRKERAGRVENIIKELRGKGLYDDDLYAHFYRIIKGY